MARARVRASLALAIDEVKQQSTALGVAQEGAPRLARAPAVKVAADLVDARRQAGGADVGVREDNVAGGRARGVCR